LPFTLAAATTLATATTLLTATTTTLLAATLFAAFTTLILFAWHSYPPCCLFFLDPAVSKDNLLNLQLHFFRTKNVTAVEWWQEQCQ